MSQTATPEAARAHARAQGAPAVHLGPGDDPRHRRRGSARGRRSGHRDLGRDHRAGRRYAHRPRAGHRCGSPTCAATPAPTCCCYAAAARSSGSTSPTRSRCSGRRTSARGRCCSPTWAGCCCRSSPTRAARHDALCGASTPAAQRRAKYGERRRPRARPQRPRPVRAGAGEVRARPSRHRAERQLLQGRARRRRRRPAFDGDPVRPRRLRGAARRAARDSCVANTPHVLDPRAEYSVTAAARHRRGGPMPTTRADPLWSSSPEGRARVPEHRRVPAPDHGVGVRHDRARRRRRGRRRPRRLGRRRGARLRRCASSTSAATRPSTASSTTPTTRPSATARPTRSSAQGNIFLVTGTRLLSNEGRPMMTITADHLRAPRHHRRRVQPGVEHAALRLPHQAPARLRRELPARALVARHGQARHASATSTGS